MDDILFERATKLLMLNRDAGWWNRQTKYPGGFLEQKRRMRDEDIRAHLHGRIWIGCRIPQHAATDRIVVDIDCEAPESITDRDERYWRIREFFGKYRVPLVWSTPSGLGLRVAYRIPQTTLSDLATKESSGLLPDALRAAGLAPAPGVIECYPASWRCDRQLFGMRMPIRDPDTLEVVPGADLNDRYSEARLRRAVEIAEEWHADVDHGLIRHLRALPSYAVPDDTAPEGLEPEINPSHGLSPPPAIIRLVREGLNCPHSRYRSEFMIGRAMWLWPELFGDLGLPVTPDREDVALCLAEWLAARANGYSQEWAESLRRGLAGAKRWWVERYLRRSTTDGLAPVDRMRRAAAAVSPDLWPTVHLTPAERRELLRIARRARWSGRLRDGADLYRFEVWVSTLLRVAKGQVRRGGASGDRDSCTAQIAAAWMEHWPWGKRYTEFRQILVDQGFLRIVRNYQKGPAADVPGHATTYKFPQFDWCRRRDLTMPPEVVRERIASLRVHDREVSIDEAYHALHVADEGLDAKRIYGRRSAERIAMYLRALRPPSILAGF